MKKHFQEYRGYYITWMAFCVCLFAISKIYAHFHLESVPLGDLYEIDKRQWEAANPDRTEIGFMSFGEWMQDQDQRHDDFVQEIGFQIAETFDPWFDRDEHR